MQSTTVMLKIAFITELCKICPASWVVHSGFLPTALDIPTVTFKRDRTLEMVCPSNMSAMPVVLPLNIFGEEECPMHHHDHDNHPDCYLLYRIVAICHSCIPRFIEQWFWSQLLDNYFPSWLKSKNHWHNRWKHGLSQTLNSNSMIENVD